VDASLYNKVLLAFFHFVVATSSVGGKPGEWGLVRSGDLVGAPDLPALFFLTGSGGSFEAPDLVGELFCPSLVFFEASIDDDTLSGEAVGR
jgi:hypothetical protein